ncbi:MAG: hypothetical protein RL701_6508 [Pseudomonadota bacterium]
MGFFAVGAAFVTRARLQSAALWVVLAALCLVHLIASLTAPAGDFDDGIQLVGAMLLRRGQLPNSDFVCVYPPLNAFLLAGAFSLFGESVVTYRIVQWLACWVALFCVTTTCSYLKPVRSSRASVLLVTLLLNSVLQELQVATGVMWSALTLTLLLAARARIGRVATRLRWCAAVCLAALAWTRINFALYFAGAWAIDAVVSYVDDTSAAQQRLRAELLSFVTPVCVIMIGSLAVWADLGGSVLELIRQILLLSPRALVAHAIQPVSGGLGFTDLRKVLLSGILTACLPSAWLACLTPAETRGILARNKLWLATALTAALVLLLGWLRPTLLPLPLCLQIALVALHHKRSVRAERTRSFVLLLCTIQLHYMLSRPDTSHFYALFIGLAWLFVSALAYADTAVMLRLVAILALAAGPAVIYNLKHVLRSAQQRAVGLRALPAMLSTDDAVLNQGCGAPCTVFSESDPDAYAATAYIRTHSSDAELVFSGLVQQSESAYNDMHAYWLLRRRSPTRHVMLMRGLTTGAAEEAEIMHDLEAQAVPWLFMRASSPARHQTTQLSALDHYLRAHYTVEQRFGLSEVWRRSP